MKLFKDIYHNAKVGYYLKMLDHYNSKAIKSSQKSLNMILNGESADKIQALICKTDEYIAQAIRMEHKANAELEDWMLEGASQSI